MNRPKKQVGYQAKSYHLGGKMGVLRQAGDWTHWPISSPKSAGVDFLIYLRYMPVVIFLYHKFPIDFKRCDRNTFDNNFSTEIITNSIRIG